MKFTFPAIAAVLCLMAAFTMSGCGTPEGNALLSVIYGANASTTSNPNEAAAFQAVSDFSAWNANRQAAERQRAIPQTIIIERD